MIDNEFKTEMERIFLEVEGNNTLIENIRTFNIEEKLPNISQMSSAVMFYNNTYHTTIKCTSFEVQNNIIDHRVNWLH